MPVKRRNNKRRGAINEYEEAWLEGDKHGWFVGVNPDDFLQALWDRAGDHENFHWEPGQHHPVPLAEME
jgi:hypothetical protein